MQRKWWVIVYGLVGGALGYFLISFTPVGTVVFLVPLLPKRFLVDLSPIFDLLYYYPTFPWYMEGMPQLVALGLGFLLGIVVGIKDRSLKALRVGVVGGIIGGLLGSFVYRAVAPFLWDFLIPTAWTFLGKVLFEFGFWVLFTLSGVIIGYWVIIFMRERPS